MKKTLTCLFLLIALSIKGDENFYFSNLSLNDGLSQITVTCIHQDRKGFMWLGTRNGLNRYDGYEFDIYRTDVTDDATISDNHILCMTEDEKGNLWIGTNNGLNYLDLYTNTFHRYYSHSDDGRTLSHNTIYSLYNDDQNNLWIGTESGLDFYESATGIIHHIVIGDLLADNRVNTISKRKDKLYIGTLRQGLIIYDLKEQTYVSYGDMPGSPHNLNSNMVKAILVDKNENLWIGTFTSGVSLLRKGGDRLTNFTQKDGLTNNNIRMITEAPDGNIMVGTFNGLSVINPQTNEITQYKEYAFNQGGLSHYSILSVFYDRSHTLWVGTYAGGVCYYSKYGQKFRFYDTDTNRKGILGIIGPILETQNSLFIATEGGGLLEMDKNTNLYRNYNLLPDTQLGYEYNIIKSLYPDNGRILCGTNLGTIYSFDPQSKKFTLFYDIKDQRSIYYLSRNKNGELIIGGVSQSGFCLLSEDGKLRKRFPVTGREDVIFSDVRCALEVEKGVYLIGTRNDGIFYYDHNQHTLKNYKNDKQKDDPYQLPENYVTDIIKDSQGEVWIGTFGGGISRFNLNTGEFRTYNAQHSMLNNNVCKIIEDDSGNLWISTNTGISEFDPKTGKFNNYTHSNGIRVNEFTPHAGIKLSNNNIVFSGNNGFIFFNPQRISVNTFIPPVVLKNLYIDNNKIVPLGDDGILKRQLDDQQEIILKYNQSNITIEYSALNYIFSDWNSYTYKLEGFDKEWNNARNRREAFYTNIPPGDYRFIVRGSNNDGVWNNVGASIKIKILPPFWKTWWAYSIYVLLGISIGILIFRYFSEKKRLQDDIRIKQVENRTREAFHQARNRLFTNFSHELRTPLTLILSPLDDIAVTENLSPKGRDSVRLMQSNARRLLRIVNNLMDFQKKESGTMKLRISENDFVAFTAEMVLFFRELALSRKIEFEYHHTMEHVSYWFDKSLMEKVYFNFLSNAFKNVPEGGRVEVNLDAMSLDELKSLYSRRTGIYSDNEISYLVLEIKDSGKGIDESELENIFIPFYQVAQNEHSASGTGLGLSLSKSIIEMHHGVIWAESPGDSGAVFKCILPVSKSLFHADEFVEEETESSNSQFTFDITENKENQVDEVKKKPYTILVVEDNKDVRNYIITHLEDNYHILEAGNGSEAIDKTLNHFPDLIITDLMMPKMDGMEMCAIIKNDIRISHIPIIMITARTMASDITEGYKAGADDYITKPFNSSVLVARVENIIHSRNQLKKLYGRNFSLETLGVKAVSLEEQFMQKLYHVLETNISNPDLSLDQFCREIGISRANLYRKIKSITELSPNEFIRNFRLNMAAKMLRETRLPVSDVYVAVGFNSHGYFSNCFKTYFGVSPTEYMNRNPEDEGMETISL